jgi:hypothetical protein
MIGMYGKFGDKKHAKEMLSRVDEFLQNPEVALWTAKSRKKITKHLKELSV